MHGERACIRKDRLKNPVAETKEVHNYEGKSWQARADADT